MRKQRCLDLRRIGGIGLISVERHARSEISAHPHGQNIDDAATEAEADRADLAGGIRTGFQPFCRRDKIIRYLAAIELAEKLCSFLLISGISTQGRKPVGSECDEVRDRQPADDIFDVRIKAAILVNDQYHRQLSGGIRRTHHVTADASVALWRLNGRRVSLDAT